MEVEVRAPAPHELDAVFDIRAQAFATPESERVDWTARVSPEHLLSAFVGSHVVGSLTMLDLGQHFGGRPVPSGAIATVVVRAEHRGQGIAAQLLAAAVARGRERGLALASLHPATVRLYRRAGWEFGGDFAAVRVRSTVLERLVPGEGDRVRPITREEALLLRPCYDAAAATHAGWLDRTPEWWERIEQDAFREQHYVYGVERDGGLEGGLAGYVIYHQARRTDWGFSLTVDELVAVEPGALLTLARFLGGNAMQARDVTFVGGDLRELLLLLPE